MYDTGSLFHTVALIISFLVFLYWWKFLWTQRKVIAAASKWPCPTWLPVLGNAHMALGGIEKVSEMMNKMSVDYGGLAVYWLGPIPLFVVSDPVELKIILNSSKAIEKDLGYNFLKPFLGNGLITAPAHIWKKNRRVLNPVFNQKNIEGFIETFNKINLKLVNALQEHVGKGEVNIYSDVLAIAAELVCRTVLGLNMVDFKSKIPKYHEDLMARVAKLLILRFNKPWLAIDPIFNFIHGNDMKKVNIMIEELMCELTQELGHDKIEGQNYDSGFTDLSSETGEVEKHNFREILTNLMETDATFTKEDMKYEIITTLAPGTDSYSATLCFCLLCLANDQDRQDKLFMEIKETLQNHSKYVTLEDINRMPYLDCVIKETFRRLSTVPFVARRATEDIKLSSYNIPAGGRIIININGMHMNPAIYPNPEIFNPERFYHATADEIHSYSLLPFSGGPRNCIAKTYSMIGLKISLIQLIRHFKFTSSLRLDKIVYQIQISKGSKNGYPVTVNLRA